MGRLGFPPATYPIVLLTPHGALPFSVSQVAQFILGIHKVSTVTVCLSSDYDQA